MENKYVYTGKQIKLGSALDTLSRSDRVCDLCYFAVSKKEVFIRYFNISTTYESAHKCQILQLAQRNATCLQTEFRRWRSCPGYRLLK